MKTFFFSFFNQPNLIVLVNASVSLPAGDAKLCINRCKSSPPLSSSLLHPVLYNPPLFSTSYLYTSSSLYLSFLSPSPLSPLASRHSSLLFPLFVILILLQFPSVFSLFLPLGHSKKGSVRCISSPLLPPPPSSQLGPGLAGGAKVHISFFSFPLDLPFVVYAVKK